MGLTRIRAEQISDIDYKQAARVITLTNVTLAGGAPSSVDGVNLAYKNRILVAGQDAGAENGLYQVQNLGTGSNGTWIRTSDANANGEIEAGMIVMVTEGDTYKDTLWKLTTNNPIIVGTTSLTFELNTKFGFGNIYANGTGVLATVQNDVLTLTAGSGMAIVGNATSKIITFSSTATGSEISNGTSNVAIATANANVTVGVAGTANIAEFTTSGLGVTGNITGGNIIAIGTVKGATIDSVNADLAERYQSDLTYIPGTVVIFGGKHEITQSLTYADPRIAGVISTQPAYRMNADANGQYVALQGRVPCRVIGKISKGDLIASSNQPGVATRLDPDDWCPGSVIGKALDDYDSTLEGTIEVVVGRT